MKSSNIFIFAIISLLWCLNGILSIKVYENVTETQKPPFTIDASTTSNMNPTAPAESQSINLFLPEDSQVSTKNPKSDDNERHVKAQIYVAENQKAKQYSDMYLKNIKPTQETENEPKKQQQSWQIPSPLSPLSTSDPKTINSTKRQTDEDIESTRAFIPSQELGSFDNTEGFVPHHEPKAIQYVAPNYLPSKPLKHDVNYGYAVGEHRLPNKDLQSFEHDFEDLKSKYPELDDLVNNYPIMEELMKQKLAEKFQQSYYLKQQNSNSEEKTKGKGSSSQEQSQEYGLNFKYPSNSNENQHYKPHTAPERPFHFDSDKFKIFKFPPKKPHFDQDASTAETPYAGEYYQGHKFPITSYAGYDDHRNNGSSVDLKGISPGLTKHKKDISPWKRVLHLITAFLPVGILLSALTPNVINIANVPDKTYPIRQRSIDDSDNINAINSKLLLNFLNGNAEKEYSTGQDDPQCDERKFCEMSQKGKNPDSNVIEKIFWNLAQSTPDHVAELVGMKNLFKAVKNSECAQFPCTDNKNNALNKSSVHENLHTSEATKNKGEIRRIKRKRDKTFVHNKY